VPVLNAGWLQIGLSAFTMHDQALPPVPPAPTPLKSIPGLIEGPAFMGWPPGMLSHKTAPSVRSDGNAAVQHGHDIGYLIPHFAIPMNAMCALNTLLSKHKVTMPVSELQVEGKPAGTYLFFLLGEICANPVSLPTGVVILLQCTVWTSLSVGDLMIGLAIICIDVVFDFIWNKVKGLIPKVPGQKNLQVLTGLGLGKMLLAPGGAKLVGGYLLREGANKVIQHILKTWILSPLVTGLPFGKSGIGRGNWAYHSFFSSSNKKRTDADH
jgi:hypothetical protein